MPCSEVISNVLLLEFVLNVNGCSGKDFNVSSSILALTAMDESDVDSTFALLIIVVCKSVALTLSVLLVNSNKYKIKMI